MSSGSSEQSQRQKLLSFVPAMRDRAVAIAPAPASVKEEEQQQPPHAPLMASNVWICQECDSAEAVVVGCYCLSCVRSCRCCVNCNTPELPSHRSSRLRHSSSATRLQYYCISCAQQPMWAMSPAPYSAPQ